MVREVRYTSTHFRWKRERGRERRAGVSRGLMSGSSGKSKSKSNNCQLTLDSKNKSKSKNK